MINGLVQSLGRKPLFSPYVDPVIAVGQVVVSSVPVSHLKDVQQEHIDSQLRNNRHARKCKVVQQITLSDLVRLGNFGFVCKLDDQK
jgi:hypothetical protein